MKHCENIINAGPIRYSLAKVSPYSFLIIEIGNELSIVGPVSLLPLET